MPEPEAPATTPSSAGKRRWLLVVFRWTVVALTVAGLLWATRSSLVRLGEAPLDWSRVRWSGLAIAAAWIGLALGCSGVFWWLVLRDLGAKVPAGLALRAFLVSQLGKYVPGKAMVIAIRVALLVPAGVRIPLAVGSVFIETLMWVAVGAVTGLGALAFSGIHLHQAGFLASLAAVGGGLATLPPVVRIVLSAAGRRFPGRQAELPGFGWRIWLAGWLLALAGWCFLALAMREILDAVGPTACPLERFPVCLAAVALAMVVGFVSMIPGGLGVRELVTLPLLASVFPAHQALAATVLFRLVSIGSEFLMTIGTGGLWIRLPAKRKDPVEAEKAS